jgi:hypothetical protein
MCAVKCSLEGFRAVQICFDDFVGEFAMLAWVARQRAHLELTAGLQGAQHGASLLSRRADDSNQFLTHCGRLLRSGSEDVIRSLGSHLISEKPILLDETHRERR